MITLVAASVMGVLAAIIAAGGGLIIALGPIAIGVVGSAILAGLLVFGIVIALMVLSCFVNCLIGARPPTRDEAPPDPPRDPPNLPGGTGTSDRR